MQLFFIEAIDGQTAWLNDEETRHCKVLRKQKGDIVHGIDGRGNRFTCELSTIGKERSELRIIETIEFQKSRKVDLHLYVSPTKNNERIEWMLEKAVETGLDGIHFIETEHSEKNRIKSERLKRIAISALKQSGQYHLPEMDDPIALKHLIKPEGLTFVAHCREGDKKSLNEVFSSHQPKGRINIFIGPEGDFSKEEVLAFKEQGAIEIRLGETRLRTETAALYSVMAISVLAD